MLDGRLDLSVRPVHARSFVERHAFTVPTGPQTMGQYIHVGLPLSLSRLHVESSNWYEVSDLF